MDDDAEDAYGRPMEDGEEYITTTIINPANKQRLLSDAVIPAEWNKLIKAEKMLVVTTQCHDRCNTMADTILNIINQGDDGDDDDIDLEELAEGITIYNNLIGILNSDNMSSYDLTKINIDDTADNDKIREIINDNSQMIIRTR